MEKVKNFWNDIAGDRIDYSQFETRYEFSLGFLPL